MSFHNTPAPAAAKPFTGNKFRLQIFFYAGWLLLTVLQALFTQIQEDEAYYWVYAQFLDWGYFDHPPLIALLVKTGSWLLPGAMGVRLLMIILNLGTIYLCEKLTDGKNPALFYAICFSVALLQISGFWAVPDVPLMFFTALFFFVYKRFLQNSHFINVLLLGLCMALLFYSKYHSILVVGFALLSHPAVLRRPQIYLVGLVAFLLYLPHLFWQYQHSWISFRYQLFENKAKPYELRFTTDYIFGQMLIAGPLAGFILLYGTIVYKPRQVIEKAMKTTALGIFIFFLLSSLRGQVEANWTAPALISLLVLGYNFLQQRDVWRRWLYRLLPFSLFIVLAVRIIMVVDILPVKGVVERFHSWKRWPQELKNRTDNKPVVFYNSYQRASMYWFLTGNVGHSLNTYEQRRNNFDFWPLEDSLLGKAVYRMDIYNAGSFEDSLQARLWKVGFSRDENYHSFTKIRLQPEKTAYRFHANDLIQFRFHTRIPSHYKNYLLQHPSVNEQVRLVVYIKKKVVKTYDLPFSLRDFLTDPAGEVKVFHDLPPGSYQFILSISSNQELFTHNSNRMVLEIEGEGL